jgi:Ca-activated chloride channel homolog
LEMAKDAAKLVLSQLKEQDKAMLLVFSDTPAEATTLTSDRQLVSDRVMALKTDYGRTALLDAVDFVFNKLEEEWGRKVVFICSDGEDNASQSKLPKVIERIKQSPDVMIIALGVTSFESVYSWMGEKEEAKQGEGLLQSLADASGGYAFFPKTLSDLGHVMEKLQRVITSQYSLAYHPTNTNMNGAWRSIVITCKRKGVKLRYRTGYFAS